MAGPADRMTLAVMDPDRALPATSARTSPVPRWVDVLAIVSLGVLALLVLLLVLSYVTSEPGLSVLGLLMAAFLMIPLSVAAGLAASGASLRRQHPRGALVLAASSAGLAGMTLLLVILSYLAGL